MGFKFRLQKVLDIRELLQEEAERQMAEAQRAKEAEQRRLDAARQVASATCAEHRKTLNGAFTAGDALFKERYRDGLAKSVESATEKVNSAEKVVVERRKSLVEASRARRVLDIVKERRVEEYKFESGRIEQQQLDDDASRRLNANIYRKTHTDAE